MKYLVLPIALWCAGCASHVKQTPVPPVETPSPAATVQKVASASDDHKLSCIHGNETRLLEVVKKGNGCVLNYTKFGKVSAVATSSHGSKHCEDSKEKVRAKLEKGDFKCNLPQS